MTKKKYILWDNDGILVDTEPWFFTANQIALAELSIVLTVDKYMEFMQSGISAWSLAVKKGIDKETIKEYRAKRDEYYKNFLTTKDIKIPGVTGALAILKEKFKMAIVTTCRKMDFETIHNDRNILQYMDFYLTNGDYERSKPAPDPYLKGMNMFNADPGECVVIEDSARGLKSAIAAGIDCIIIRNKFTGSHDFSGAKCMVDKISDLPDLLK